LIGVYEQWNDNLLGWNSNGAWAVKAVVDGDLEFSPTDIGYQSLINIWVLALEILAVVELFERSEE
jgi:hypothetical protein